MALNVSAWSIRNPIPGLLLFVILCFAGLTSFRAMKVQNFPDIELPVVTVTAALPGASPSQLESEVARRLENALVGVQGVRHLRSTLTEGSVSIAVEFQLDKPLQEAADEVRDAVAGVRGDLPADLRDPVIQKANMAGSTILTYTVGSARPADGSALEVQALSWFVDNDASRALLAVPGVGSVARVGGATREVRVALDPARLLALNLSAAELSRQLRDMQQEAAAGRAQLGGGEQSVRALATVKSAHEVGAIELTPGHGRPVRLDQVADVRDTVAEPRSAALLDGRPVVAFEVTRARGASDLAVAAGVRQAVQALRAAHPGLHITEVIDEVAPVQENYDGSMRLLLEGAALAVVVVALFLRDWRATVVSAVALPLSIIPAFAAMHAAGFGLDTVTLLALSLVVGVLVDDAIVEIENIERHLRMGKTPWQAAMEAADEIGLAVIATTFTLIAVFLPTVFMSGVVGRVFLHFGWTASIAVFFSLVVARVLTPMMAAHVLRAPQAQAPQEPSWIGPYLAGARWCLRHRGWTMAAALAFLVAGLVLAARLPGASIPGDDLPQTQVTLTLAPGGTLADTLATAEQARVIVSRHAHVKQVYTAVGARGSTDGGPGAGMGGSAAPDLRQAVLTLALTHRNHRAGLPQEAIETALREALAVLPGARVQVGLKGSSDPYTLVLTGPDGAALAAHAARVERELRGIPGVGAVTSSAGLLQPELVVRPDFARAADLGVSSAAIAETLRVATAGDHEQQLAKLNLSERQVPVVVRLDAAARQDLDLLRRLPVPGTRGSVALENVADLALGSAPVQITRQDRARNINLDVELNGLDLGVVEAAALKLPSLQQLPPGVSVRAAGDAERHQELAQGFAMAMLTGVLCI